MTAPIFDYEIKGYDLKTELHKVDDNKYIVKIIQIYNYDDVWEARNAYEKFFRDDDVENKRIAMVGDKKCMVVTFVELYEFLTLAESKDFENEIKKEYKFNLAINKYMRADVLRMIENYDEASKNQCFLHNEIERTMNMQFEDMGMKSHSLLTFKRLRISSVKDLLKYWDDVDKMRKEGGFLCSGKYLTKSCMDELTGLLKEDNMDWLLLRENKEEEEIEIAFD